MKRKANKIDIQNIGCVLAFKLHRFYIFSATAFVLLLFSYLYFVFGAIYYTSLSKEVKLQISKLSADISGLEAEYLKKYGAVRYSTFKSKLVTLSDADKVFLSVDSVLGRAD